VSYAARIRLRLRTEAKPDVAAQVQTRALTAAWQVLPKALDDIGRDGKVQDEVLDAARQELSTFYKFDEANAFDLWYSNKNQPRVLVLYFESHRGHAPIWSAVDETGTRISDEKRLPANAFKAMRHAAR
jgi:hypothetical protein